MNQDILRAKTTAISRNRISAPTLYLFGHTQINKNTTVLDYGCGKGKDVECLNALGVKTVGYDPNYFPDEVEGRFDVIICNFVFNVLPVEYQEDLINKLRSLGRKIYVSVRNDIFIDGLTKRGTFQRNVSFEKGTARLLNRTSSYRLYELKPS